MVEGHFGFRTVRNRETIDNFKVQLLVTLRASTQSGKDNVVARTVPPGDSIQDEIDQVSVRGAGVVALAAGAPNINSPVKLGPVTLQGEEKLAELSR